MGASELSRVPANAIQRSDDKPEMSAWSWKINEQVRRGARDDIAFEGKARQIAEEIKHEAFLQGKK